jgi:hypothetical protein
MLLGAVAASLAACGEDPRAPVADEGLDAAAIVAILEERRTDPASICDHMTAELLEQVGGAKNCRQLSVADDHRDAAATTDDVSVDGDRATVRLTGADGKQTVAFVRVDGEWRLTRDQP